MKHLMSGNEATARGVYEAGIKICSAYPGTPSTEILENLPQYKDDVYCEWALPFYTLFLLLYQYSRGWAWPWSTRRAPSARERISSSPGKRSTGARLPT